MPRHHQGPGCFTCAPRCGFSRLGWTRSIGLCAGLALEFALELPFAGAAQLAHEVGGRTRDKIICEFGQATYEYVIQFPIVLQSMPAMTLPRLIYDYEPTHMQQLYCRSQMRPIVSFCQFRDLAVIVRDEQLSAGTAYDPATVKPLSWANIASVV